MIQREPEGLQVSVASEGKKVGRVGCDYYLVLRRVRKRKRREKREREKAEKKRKKKKKKGNKFLFFGFSFLFSIFPIFLLSLFTLGKPPSFFCSLPRHPPSSDQTSYFLAFRGGQSPCHLLLWEMSGEHPPPEKKIKLDNYRSPLVRSPPSQAPTAISLSSSLRTARPPCPSILFGWRLVFLIRIFDFRFFS